MAGEEKYTYAYMFVSRNKDNRDIQGFKERRKAFLSTKKADDLMPAFERFVADGKDGEYCRFYRSVNPRDLEKAKKKLIVSLVEADNADTLLRIEARTVSIAMTVECAADRRWLFDFDNSNEDDLSEFIDDVIQDGGFEQVSCYTTPHGFGVVVPHGFDTRHLMAKWDECCDLKRDAMEFIAHGSHQKDTAAAIVTRFSFVRKKKEEEK